MGTTGGMQLALSGGFRLSGCASTAVLPGHAQRVLAYLALIPPADTACPRVLIAERLWGDGTGDRAQASLRTAIWRIRSVDRRLVRADREFVQLGTQVEVDVRRGLEQAHRVLSDSSVLDPADADIDGLPGDLLPTWEEDWLLLERERIRQIRIHTLEALSRRQCAIGKFGSAIEAAYAAIADEPLRESAHSALIEVHLAERNFAAAWHQLHRCAALLHAELGVGPSAVLVARVRDASSVALGEQRPRPVLR